MPDRPIHVLFLCTGNSARSIIAEALLDRWGHGRFKGCTAGSLPKGEVHPLTLRAAAGARAARRADLRSKSLGRVHRRRRTGIGLRFTVCDQAAGEVCPIWPGQPIDGPLGRTRPGCRSGTPAERMRAFRQAFRMLERRMQLFLPHRTRATSRAELTGGSAEIGRMATTRRKVRRRDGSPARSRHRAGRPRHRHRRALPDRLGALCIVAGIVLGQLPGAVPCARRRHGRRGQSAGRGAGLADDRADAAQDRSSRRSARSASTGAASPSRCSSTGLVKPFSMALLGWLFIGWLFRAAAAGRPDRQLHRRPDPAGRGALHGHGVRLVEPDRRRAEFHAEPGRAQRHDHGVRLRADRRRCCSACPRSPCPGTRCSCRSCSTSSCR